jgi:hypothetical protein
MEPLELRKLMSLAPQPVPLPNSSALTNPIDALWRQALGSPDNGLRAAHVAQALGTNLPVLSTYPGLFK